MRVLPLALCAMVMLAGCSGSADQDAPDEDPALLTPLPPPRSNNPANNIGTGTIDDVTGQVPPSTWARECVRQWTSGAYTYQDAPIVDGLPCWFRPTAEGTLFWHVVNFTGSARGGVPAAPVERQDGFFDWAVFDQPDHREPGGVLRFYENGSTEPLVDWGYVAGDPRDGFSAVRFGDVVHVLLPGLEASQSLPTGGSAGTPRLIHAWWSPGGPPEVETFPAAFPAMHHTWRQGPTGTYAIGVTGTGFSNTVLQAGLGAWEVLPPLPGAVYDVIEHDREVHVCMTLGNTYLHAWMPISRETDLGPWLTEPITTSPLAQLAFTCDITATDNGLVVVIDSPAPFGGGPNPLEGSYAFTRQDSGQWHGVPMGFPFHSGDDLATVAGQPYHVVATGSGTSSSDPQCGHTVRTIVVDAWQEVFCNHADDWAYLVDHEQRPIIVASGMTNPPFDTWRGGSDDSGSEMTSVALVLPPAGPVSVGEGG